MLKLNSKLALLIAAIFIFFITFIEPSAILACNCNANLLISNNRWKELAADVSGNAALIARCNKDIGVVARPMESLNLPNHYTKDGVNQESKERGKILSLDAQMAYRAAYCYKLTGDVKYAKHTQELADAWGKTLKSVPSLQGVANVNFYFPYFIIGTYWVRGTNNWNDSDWKRFLKEMIAPLSQTKKNENNHADWGLLLDVTIASYLQDNNLLKDVYNDWQRLVKSQISDKGIFKREICRSDTNNYCGGPTKGIKGIAYTHYAMLPLTMTAAILQNQYRPVWNTDAGQLFRKAYIQLSKWMVNPKKFPYYKSNKGNLIGVHNGAYFAILQHYYQNKYAAKILKENKQGMDGFQLARLFLK